MNNEEKVRVLSRGLRAAMRWLYDNETREHVIDPPEFWGQTYDPSYATDVQEMHAAYLIAKESK